MSEVVPPPTNGQSISHVDDRLESWKEIATYLNRGVRTVQRWERTEGLPVCRHRHDKRGTVYAFRREVDMWREERRERRDSQGATPEIAGSDKAGVVNLVRGILLPRRKMHRAVRLAALILLGVAAIVAGSERRRGGLGCGFRRLHAGSAGY
jgi:hypothetical protein